MKGEIFMNKNTEYVHRYVDGLSEKEAKESLKRILSDQYTNEKTNEFERLTREVGFMYLRENAEKPVKINIPKLKP